LAWPRYFTTDADSAFLALIAKHVTPPEKQKPSEELRAFIAGRGDGIAIDTPRHWVTEEIGREHFAKFFESLSMLLPEDSILYFEGTSIAPDAALFYSAHRAQNAVEVARDTIFPVPDTYHVCFTRAVIAGLIELMTRHQQQEEMFDHVKGYRGDKLLFSFHDAFCGWFRISQHVSAEAVEKFAAALGVAFLIEETKQCDNAELQKILELMQDPDGFRKIRIQGEPFWRTWWRRWTGR
jgi:hypothetical protein